MPSYQTAPTRSFIPSFAVMSPELHGVALVCSRFRPMMPRKDANGRVRQRPRDLWRFGFRAPRSRDPAVTANFRLLLELCLFQRRTVSCVSKALEFLVQSHRFGAANHSDSCCGPPPDVSGPSRLGGRGERAPLKASDAFPKARRKLLQRTLPFRFETSADHHRASSEANRGRTMARAEMADPTAMGSFVSLRAREKRWDNRRECAFEPVTPGAK